MSDKIKLDHVGGWPKIIDAPEHRGRFGSEESRPHEIEIDVRAGLWGKKNAFAAFVMISRFYDMGLYPPKWALATLVEGINKHLKDPDPDLLAGQLGLTARGSGSTSPRQEYEGSTDEASALAHAWILVAEFGLTMMDASRAVVEMHEFDITAKRWADRIRKRFPEFNKQLKRFREEEDPFTYIGDTDEDRKAYISMYPRRAQNIIRASMKRRNKT